MPAAFTQAGIFTTLRVYAGVEKLKTLLKVWKTIINTVILP